MQKRYKISDFEFWYKTDTRKTNNMIAMAGFEKWEHEAIWKKERTPFEVYNG